jgi:large subunit ribosomal protein L4
METPKTRELVSFLSSIAPEGKVLVLTDGKNENLYLSSRNLSNVSVIQFGGESVYDVLWAYTVVIERSALDEKASSKAKAKAKAKVEDVEAEPAAQAEVEAADEPEAEAEVEPVAEAADEPEAAAKVETEDDDDA